MAAQTLFQSKVGFFRAKLQQSLYGALLTLLVVLQAAALRCGAVATQLCCAAAGMAPPWPSRLQVAPAAVR